MPDLRVGAFASRHLDPGARMGEMLFGLIMTLTFTLGAGLVIEEEGRKGAREMLVAILGCNLAWGIIDGVLYALGQVFDRARLHGVGARVRQAKSDDEARAVVAAEYDATLAPIMDEPDRTALYLDVAQRVRALPQLRARLGRADVMGGLASGWLVFACSFPAVIPFLLVDEPRLALRISNAILIALLFLVGYRIARYTLARPWIVGSVFALIGVALTAIAIRLGG